MAVDAFRILSAHFTGHADNVATPASAQAADSSSTRIDAACVLMGYGWRLAAPL